MTPAPRRWLSVAAMVSALAVALAGCATESGGVPGELSRAASAAQSAAASGELAVRLLSDARTTATATDVALLDMVADSQDAEVAAATLVVDTDPHAHLRDETLTRIHAGTQALVAARTWASALGADPAAAPQVLDDLRASSDALTSLSDRLQAMP